MINFSAANIHTDGPLVDHWAILLRIVCDFRIFLRDDLWYEEKEFCVLEFVRELLKWATIEDSCGAWEYKSMESAEPWLIRAWRVREDLWRLEAWDRCPSVTDSVATDSVATDSVRIADVRAATDRLLNRLATELPGRDYVLTLLSENPENRQLVDALDLAIRGERREPGHRH